MATDKPWSIDLFGGVAQWTDNDWTSSDDRVRGGASQSYLTIDSKTARFYGTLDIKTLGGAGFASQRTTRDDRVWDLSSYDGLVLDVFAADDNQYTFILKDELLPKSPNGREQSTISWEYDFKVKPEGQKVFISWAALKPTYRGKEKKDAKPLDLKSVKRMSIMMRRSFFGTQEGQFSLTLRSISVSKFDKQSLSTDDGTLDLRKPLRPDEKKDRKKPGFFATFSSCFGNGSQS